ncbi:MAG: hypothetical protein IJR90_01765 [Clostridia bacterium]|nr:hypothetical protein [Clostridia bacterium]
MSNTEVINSIRDFLSGKTDIVTFRGIFDSDPEIEAFLQSIVDNIKEAGKPLKKYRHTVGDREYESAGDLAILLDPPADLHKYGNYEYSSVHNFLTYEKRMITHDVETAAGASGFYERVYSIYYQYDQSVPRTDKYFNNYSFSLKVIPEYLAGGEAEKYISKHIIPLFPETMKETERKKAIKAKIREEFKTEKGRPCWVQSSEWPLGRDGRPATYLGKGKSSGDMRSWRFRDGSTGEIIVIEQYL